MSDDGLGYMMARAFEMADRMQDAFCDDAPKMKNAPGQHPEDPAREALARKVSDVCLKVKGALFTPEKITFDGKTTVVRWTDGTKTVVICRDGDEYDKEKGLLYCYIKKLYGNKGDFYEDFGDVVEADDEAKKKKAAKAEKSAKDTETTEEKACGTKSMDKKPAAKKTAADKKAISKAESAAGKKDGADEA